MVLYNDIIWYDGYDMTMVYYTMWYFMYGMICIESSMSWV